MRRILKFLMGVFLWQILLALFFFILHKQYSNFENRQLEGAILESKPKKLTLSNWFDGSFQLGAEQYLNENFGFRNFLIRLHNQFAFSVFHKAKANGVIIGKNNYLFEEGYIEAYYGNDFIGDDKIKSKIKQLRMVKDTLEKLNKSICFVFAAGKGSYYPEYFPNNYKQKRKVTNYQIFLENIKEQKINHIDFNDYFVRQKKKSVYPLYPQYGIHWSQYGMFIAADSIIKYIEKMRGIDMPNLYFKEIHLNQPNGTDYDIAAGMNILSTLKSFNMAYPNILIEDSLGKVKPSVLVISDSFYWGMFNFGISNAFDKSHFWFYNKEVYPDTYNQPLSTDQLDISKEIQKHDVFIVMATEATLKDAGWGFIERLYKFFFKSKNVSK